MSGLKRLVYSLSASLPLSRSADQRRATVAFLNRTSVSHSAPSDWTPTVSTVHKEPSAGWVVFPRWNAGGMKNEEVWKQGVEGCSESSLLTDGANEKT